MSVSSPQACCIGTSFKKSEYKIKLTSVDTDILSDSLYEFILTTALLYWHKL